MLIPFRTVGGWFCFVESRNVDRLCFQDLKTTQLWLTGAACDDYYQIDLPVIDVVRLLNKVNDDPSLLEVQLYISDTVNKMKEVIAKKEKENGPQATDVE